MRRLLSVFFSILLCVIVQTVAAKPLNQIVVFGDSLSDNGNLYEYMKQQLPLSPPYFKGRFSNGPVWVELLADHVFPTNTASSHLLDYAFGGAGVLGPDGDFEDETLLSLNREIDSYLLAHQDKASPDAMFVIWIGANNYLTVPDDKDEAIENVVWGIRTSTQRLIDHGAQHFLIINLPDLGRTPFAREMEMQDELSYYANQHNALLEKNVAQLRSENPTAELLSFDVNKFFEKSIADPQQFGFSNITDTCYEAVLDPKASHSLLNMVAHIRPKLQAADACDGYFFFDPVHPTGLTHRLISEYVIDALNEAHIEFAD